MAGTLSNQTNKQLQVKRRDTFIKCGVKDGCDSVNAAMVCFIRCPETKLSIASSESTMAVHVVSLDVLFGGRNSSLIMFGLNVHSVVGSILL